MNAPSFHDLPVHHLERPGGRIAYRVTGEGPLVVCIPGMGELASSFRFTVPALAAAGFRVAAMDLRGHGDSDTTFDAYDDAAAGSDALALARHLGGRAVLAGNSLGAGAAVWAAAEDPSAVAGLVLIGPFVRNPPTNPVMGMIFRIMMARPWARQAWLAYLPSLYPGDRPADFEEHRSRIRAAMTRPGYTRAFAATTHTDHAVAEERLDRVTAPTAVVMGSRDPDFADPAAEADWIAQRLDARITMIDGAGHYPQAQRPDEVNDVLIAFCRQVTADA
ncbi:alpha/beta fold hydrolase [Microbacterium thalassium]|uniref:Pimeloyl-ACP methyl ester carboxylesterase n=1 Tax=Microbacterium thalassium TaxID=362649 RepID=A0A7X0FSG1_9MICO|nr:alpha/beta hydrolase [Microbacterium thalassium]MBB6392885.1 pimeloyl-ACP methyl ester carboxylesterase [Microbacterium thalassium]GLK22884.1 hydrolase [Microbacterium thalassium]